MTFQGFMEMEFFKSELEDTKKRVEEKGQQKQKLNSLVACADIVKWNGSRVQTVLTYTQAFLA